MSASKRFEPPIPVPKGPPLKTIGEAVKYIDKLPKKEQLVEEWQDALGALILVVEGDGPAMFARMGITRALGRNDPPVQIVRTKPDRPWMKRKAKA